MPGGSPFPSPPDASPGIPSGSRRDGPSDHAFLFGTPPQVTLPGALLSTETRAPSLRAMRAATCQARCSEPCTHHLCVHGGFYYSSLTDEKAKEKEGHSFPSAKHTPGRAEPGPEPGVSDPHPCSSHHTRHLLNQDLPPSPGVQTADNRGACPFRRLGSRGRAGRRLLQVTESEGCWGHSCTDVG